MANHWYAVNEHLPKHGEVVMCDTVPEPTLQEYNPDKYAGGFLNGGFLYWRHEKSLQLMSKWVPEMNPMILRRIGKTGEEASELLKVINRIIIQGYNGVDPETGVPNPEALEKEIADVYAQLDETMEAFHYHIDRVEARRALKRKWMKEWEAQFKDGDQA